MSSSSAELVAAETPFDDTILTQTHNNNSSSRRANLLSSSKSISARSLGHRSFLGRSISLRDVHLRSSEQRDMNDTLANDIAVDRPQADNKSDNSSQASASHTTHNNKPKLLNDIRIRTKAFLTTHNEHHNNTNLPQQQSSEPQSSIAQRQPPPDSDVERIVQRLEQRNANRLHVPVEVKNRFLRLCKDASINRQRQRRQHSSVQNGIGAVAIGEEIQEGGDSSPIKQLLVSQKSSINMTLDHTNNNTIQPKHQCILRTDIISIRNSIRLQVESRTYIQRLNDAIRNFLGFKTHCKLLLMVLNKALDMIDNSGTQSRRRRSSAGGNSLTNLGSFNLDTSYEENNIEQGNIDDENEEWFYYKDFAFYHLKVESNYPWIRNTAIFSILVTLAFYIMTPILWCTILRDENICPQYQYDVRDFEYVFYDTTGEIVESGKKYHGWLSALFFASATMSTVGYGDVTVLQNSGHNLEAIDIDSNEPETWRIFIAILYMILSLVVSVVGFQAGLDSHFHPFRQRLDTFGRRVYEILRDAKVVKGGRNDKHEEIRSRMRWSKILQLSEICLIFLILNLVGVLAVQVSLLIENEDKIGDDKLYISWMESFYWSVQTTTTIGYGDVETPEGLRWFLLFYLAISTYFVGTALGNLGEIGQKAEDMQRFYLWQQQEATYSMLRDFSGRPGSGNTNGEGGNDTLDFEPEIDQFEFTIASLVVMGKITSEDVKPILEKFKRLTGENSNKITSADVSGVGKKREDDVSEKAKVVNNQDKLNDMEATNASAGSGVLGKIATAFKEEVLSSNPAASQDKAVVFEEKEEDKPVDYSDFRIPSNTYAIAIDDSKIQRKLLGKIFEHAGIPTDRCTIVGDGYEEIMGFEDYVVTFMSTHDGYVFMIVDENLDIVDEATNKHDTISGSQCIENIRRRLSPEIERRMFALIRSANDSSSDIAIYNTRAHAFLPKQPIKRDKMKETLGPMWLKRFPPSEFGEQLDTNSSSNQAATPSSGDIACTPYDVESLLNTIESLFQKDIHVNEPRLIKDKMHELKGDLLTMNSNIPVHSLVGQVNQVLVTQSPDTLLERWSSLRDSTKEILSQLQKNFRIPSNTYAIAIDDSKIQRKLLGKFFDFLKIPPSQCTIVGDGSTEIKGFEDFVVKFMQEHTDDYVLMVVDENLDTVDETTNESINISGSQCVDNIRKRLPEELEKRMLALVRSANDSTTDIAIYNKKAHGFLPKAPIRREKVNETIAPIWMRRFPASDFVDSARVDISDDSNTVSTSQTDELACTPYDIAQKLVDIESLFKKELHISDIRPINDQLHELKGDLLTLGSDTSLISIIGMINLMLLGQKQSPDVIIKKWHALRDRIYTVINSMENGDEVKTASKSGFFRLSKLSVGNKSSTLSQDSPKFQRRRSTLSISAVSTCSSKLSDDDSNVPSSPTK